MNQTAPGSRNSEDRRRGKRAEPAAVQNECGSRWGGRHQPRSESKRLAQSDRRRLLREDGIRPCFDRKAVDVFGLNNAADARGGFEYLERDPANSQLVRGCESGDASSDDCNHRADFILVVIRDPGSGMRDPSRTGNWQLVRWLPRFGSRLAIRGLG